MAQVLRITKKIEKTITVNDKEFINDFIDFKQCGAYWDGETRMLPTSQCFVHVWQKSNNLDDFLDNMQRLFDVVRPKCKRSLGNCRYNAAARAARFRAKGVKLQRFLRDASASELNRIIELSKGV